MTRIHYDVLTANRLGYALYSEMDLAPGRPANHARFVLVDLRSVRFFCEWERVADDTVAMLRTEAGRYPHDRNMTDLVGELATRSEEFRGRWAAHDVRAHQTGAKRYHHPSSASSPSPTNCSSSQPTPAWISSPSAPNPAQSHTTR